MTRSCQGDYPRGPKLRCALGLGAPRRPATIVNWRSSPPRERCRTIADRAALDLTIGKA